jgi:hypothetical protein
VIKFHSKQNPAKGSLVGKFVFADGEMHYASYARPTMVVREMGVSLEGQRLNRAMDNGVVVAISVSNEDETEVMRRASVACVCDTLDDVNAVFRANFASRSLHNASVEEGKQLFRALDGTEVAPDNAPPQRTPKP